MRSRKAFQIDVTSTVAVKQTLHLAGEIRETPIQELQIQKLLSETHGTSLSFPRLYLKREDLCHDVVSGNKWHKLSLNLEKALDEGFERVVSFGGAWSNHIHALAYACRSEGLILEAVIRGEELASKPLNPMLQDVADWGGRLHFVSRSEYRQRYSESYQRQLSQRFGRAYLVPEGGANKLGVEGSRIFAKNTLAQFEQQFGVAPSHLVLASGSGTMTAGFIQAVEEANKEKGLVTSVLSFLAARDKERVRQFVSDMLVQDGLERLELIDDYCVGGFAKSTPALHAFSQAFTENYNIELDPVYTGKMMFGLFQMLEQNRFSQDGRLLVIHSGGLQGLRSLSA